MIHDHFSRIALYRPLSRNIDLAIDYVKNTDLNALTPGRHAVDGDNVYAVLHETDTLLGGAKWESHRKYIDLQLMLRGHERQAVADIASLEVETPFSAEKDVVFYKPTEKFLMADLRDNQFVFYFPHDAHLPLIAPGEIGQIRKLVVKIAAK